jgi:hypothetical protein
MERTAVKLSVEERQDIEKKSSAVSLSDMEMFIFPDLIYSLLLANLMSPIIWRWREDPWFDDIKRKSIITRINRVKQYIMDRYVFNLDLETWGLTTKEKELERFQDFIDLDMLAQSNALFGYEGDKYYFDIDIRTHFNLDKYTSNVIPYWKTETVEAMTAFELRDGYETGAGECVSLAVLYAAALFIILDIPLEKIYMMATPLHSQNFIDVGEGLLTNNRRIVTKKMWFNGTALSAQARRSLENERVTLVAHESGSIHIMYPDATMSPDAYEKFRKKLSSYLITPLTSEMLGNFLRQAPECHKCVMVRTERNNRKYYIPISRVFEYERDHPYRVTDNTRQRLLNEIEQSEFSSERDCDHCLVLNDLEEYLTEQPVDLTSEEDTERLVERFRTACFDADETVQKLIRFCRTIPRMPNLSEKTFHSDHTPLNIKPGMTREEIIERIETLRDENEYCRLAFYAWRDLSRTDPEPFLQAAVERNPVCIEKSKENFPDDAELVQYVSNMRDGSIYEGESRLAQPDEVWNFSSGDGLERAIMLGVILNARNGKSYQVESSEGKATLKTGNGEVVAEMPSQKSIPHKILPVGS